MSAISPSARTPDDQLRWLLKNRYVERRLSQDVSLVVLVMVYSVRRGWWKPWNWSTRRWLVAIVVSMLLCPFVVRWICLWQVPDVALPFVVDDVIGVEVPTNDDAFTAYAVVFQALGTKSNAWLLGAVDQATRAYDPQWDERLDQWFASHENILAQFERASEMERAQWISPKVIHFNVHIAPLQNLRTLARLPVAVALRCQRSGELEQAWKWYRTALRCAGHAQKPGVTVANGSGRSIRTQTYFAIAEWAGHPSLTAERLRAARVELAQDASTRMMPSDVMKVDYFMIKNTTERDYFPNLLYPQWETASLHEQTLLIGKRFYLWTIGQPDVSMRLCRQLMVNNLDQIDLPLHRRRSALRPEYPMVFELDPEQRHVWGQLKAEQLVGTLQSPLGQHLIEIELFTDLGPQKAHPSDLDRAHRFGEAHVSMIDLVLAAQEFQRVHHEFPASLQQLVPEFLDAVPFDPMSPSGAPMNYRHEVNGDVVIWSLGYDQTDDGGDIEGKEPKDAGYRIRVNSPTDR